MRDVAGDLAPRAEQRAHENPEPFVLRKVDQIVQVSDQFRFRARDGMIGVVRRARPLFE